MTEETLIRLNEIRAAAQSGTKSVGHYVADIQWLLAQLALAEHEVRRLTAKDERIGLAITRHRNCGLGYYPSPRDLDLYYVFDHS